MELVRTVFLAAHLVAMNIASAGPLVCLWLEGRGRRGDDAADRVGRRLAWWACTALALGAVIGALLLGLAWAAGDRAYFDALGRFPTSALANAGGEIVFSLACLAVYAATWDRWRGRPWLHGVWPVLAATNLVYHFPPLMIAVRELAGRPELVVEETISRSVFRSLMVLPEILSQTAHFILASVAVAGVAVMQLARRERLTTRGDGAASIIRGGARVALAASLAQLAVGVWVLLELPAGVRGSLTGDDWQSTGLFLLGIGIAVAVLHTLGIASLGAISDGIVRRSAVLMLAAVVLMTCVTRSARPTGHEGNIKASVASGVTTSVTVVAGLLEAGSGGKTRFSASGVTDPGYTIAIPKGN